VEVVVEDVRLVLLEMEQEVAVRPQDLLLQITLALQPLQVVGLTVVMVATDQVKVTMHQELRQRLETTGVCTYHGN
jgi:hypothetical protein